MALALTSPCSADETVVSQEMEEGINFAADNLTADIFLDYLGRWENPTFPKESIEIINL